MRVFAASVVKGVNLAVTPAYVTVPKTAVAPCFSVKVVVLIVKGFIASLKVAETALPIGTFVAPLVGTVELTVGGVRPGPRLL